MNQRRHPTRSRRTSLRRHILPALAASGLAICLSNACMSPRHPAAGKAHEPATHAVHEETGSERFEFNQPHMGVPFRIVLHGNDPGRARAAATDAFNRIRELNGIMSDYDPESELSRLSRTSATGARVPVSRDLWNILERSQQLSQATEGAFDVTVGSMVHLWRRARREGKIPDAAELEKARAASGYRQMRLHPEDHTVELRRPGMRLDLGGIGKGYAVDEAIKILKSHGFARAMVGAAGDIGVGDAPPGRDAWRLEIGALDHPRAPPSRLANLTNAAVATSGDLFQHLDANGVRYSHILDPRTGLGLTNSAVVTVIARDSTTADSLATAVSVLGIAEGLKLVEATPGAAALIVQPEDDGFKVIESRLLTHFAD